MSKLNSRALAAQIAYAVHEQGQSLTAVLPVAQAQLGNPKDKSFVAQLSYGLMRYFPQLDDLIKPLLEKPIKHKQRIAHFCLLVGAYQIYFTRVAPHAAISETVDAAKQLKMGQFSGLINAVLRKLVREKPTLSTRAPSLEFNHPNWLIKRLQRDYPTQWQDILTANNQQAPMWLRVNRLKVSRDQYLSQLLELGIDASAGNSPDSILLSSPCDVSLLPNFADGHASVQDYAAQQSAYHLDPEAGDIVLDACAAPGGKTCHLLEYQPEIKELIAIDADANRLERVQQNLDRLNLSASLIHCDATNLKELEGKLFDKILLDAPCSATGVIRRHPDIKWLRKSSDIESLAELQMQIFQHVWQFLKPGGTLIYATCSVLKIENSDQVTRFLELTPQAEHIPISLDINEIGLQFLPGQNSADGFYYAKLIKRNA